MGNVNAELEESISGVREVQAFSRESENIATFRDVNAANRDANIRAVAFTSALAPTLEALGYVAIAIVAGVGGFLLLRNETLVRGGHLDRHGDHLPGLRPTDQRAGAANLGDVGHAAKRHRGRRAHLRPARCGAGYQDKPDARRCRRSRARSRSIR